MGKPGIAKGTKRAPYKKREGKALSNYEVFAYVTEEGRKKLRQVCTFQCTDKEDAVAKATNFCGAFGSEYSHVRMERKRISFDDN